jgi:hypothetical protein
MYVTRPRNFAYFHRRSLWAVEDLDRFGYADGLVNAVTGGVWNDPSNLLTIASSKAASPAGVNRQQMNHTLAASINLTKRYRFGGRVKGNDFGGATEIFVECTAIDDQSGNRCQVIYTTAGGAIQIDLFQAITNRGTAAQAVLSPLIRPDHLAGNNFGIEFDLVIDMGANDSGGAGNRTCAVYVNGTQVISTSLMSNSPNLNKRLALGMNWGPTQLFTWDNVFFDGLD